LSKTTGEHGRHFEDRYSHFGADTYGHDLKAFGDTTGQYVFWDASAGTLYVVGTLSLDGTFAADNIALVDAETLTFGTGSDVVMQWDGTNFLIAAAADDSLIEIGDSASTQKSFDLKWYGGEASGASYLYFDASANLIYTTGVDLQFKDNDVLVFGTGSGATGDIGITYDANSLNITPTAASDALEIGAAGHVLNTTLLGTFTVGVNDTGYDVKLFGATTGKYCLWDESEDTLTILGKAAITQDASATAQPFKITATSASTSGSDSVESMLVSTTMTGPGGVGGSARFALAANAAQGGWVNALKAHTTFGAAGSCSDMGSSFCAELTLSAGTTAGTYAPLEAELVLGETASTGTATSFLYGNVTGHATGIGTFNHGGYLFELGAGCTIDTDHIVQAAAVTDIDSTHAIRIRVAGTTLYIPAHTSKTFAP